MRITNLIDITSTLLVPTCENNAMWNDYNESIVITYEFSWSLEHSLYPVFTVATMVIGGNLLCTLALAVRT